MINQTEKDATFSLFLYLCIQLARKGIRRYKYDRIYIAFVDRIPNRKLKSAGTRQRTVLYACFQRQCSCWLRRRSSRARTFEAISTSFLVVFLPSVKRSVEVERRLPPPSVATTYEDFSSLRQELLVETAIPHASS